MHIKVKNNQSWFFSFSSASLVPSSSACAIIVIMSTIILSKKNIKLILLWYCEHGFPGPGTAWPPCWAPEGTSRISVSSPVSRGQMIAREILKINKWKSQNNWMWNTLFPNIEFPEEKTISAWRLDIVCYKSQSKIISKCHLISGHLAPHTKGPSPGLSLAVHHHLPHLLLLSDLTAVQGCARSLMGGQIHLWAACAISFTCHRRRQSRCKMWALRNPNPPQKVTLQPTRKSGHHRLASVVSSNLQPGNVWHQYTWLLHWLLRSSLCWHW